MLPTPDNIIKQILIHITSEDQIEPILKILDSLGWQWRVGPIFKVGDEPESSILNYKNNFCGGRWYFWLMEEQKLCRGGASVKEVKESDVIEAYDILNVCGTIKINRSVYNAKCPICGQSALDLVFSLECSNPQCQNGKK